MVVPCEKSDMRDQVPAADDEGDRNRFADRPAEPKDDRSPDPGGGGAEDGHPGSFPARRAEAERGFPLLAGDRPEGLSREGRDRGHDHDPQDRARGEHPEAKGRSREQEPRPGDVCERGLDGRLHDGLQDLEGPEPVDDRGNGCPEVDEVGERRPEARRRDLRGEQGNPEPYRDREHEREHAREKRSDNRRLSAELVATEVPLVAGEEPEPEPFDRGERVCGQEGDERGGEEEHPDGGRRGAPPERTSQEAEEARSLSGPGDRLCGASVRPGPDLPHPQLQVGMAPLL